MHEEDESQDDENGEWDLSQNRRRLFLENDFFRKWLGNNGENVDMPEGDDSSPFRQLLDKIFIKKEDSQDDLESERGSLFNEDILESPTFHSDQEVFEDEVRLEREQEDLREDTPALRRNSEESFYDRAIAEVEEVYSASTAPEEDSLDSAISDRGHDDTEPEYSSEEAYQSTSSNEEDTAPGSQEEDDDSDEERPTIGSLLVSLGASLFGRAKKSENKKALNTHKDESLAVIEESLNQKVLQTQENRMPIITQDIVDEKSTKSYSRIKNEKIAKDKIDSLEKNELGSHQKHLGVRELNKNVIETTTNISEQKNDNPEKHNKFKQEIINQRFEADLVSPELDHASTRIDRTGQLTPIKSVIESRFKEGKPDRGFANQVSTKGKKLNSNTSMSRGAKSQMYNGSIKLGFAGGVLISLVAMVCYAII